MVIEGSRRLSTLRRRGRSDTFEIESSKLAATRAQSAKVKRFAEEMIKAHTASTAKLKTAAAAASPALTPVPRLSPAQQQTLDALKAYSASGAVPSLKTFAGGGIGFAASAFIRPSKRSCGSFVPLR